jgi:sulfur-carrier protein adenylyltransferase/sulfurtransferase
MSDAVRYAAQMIIPEIGIEGQEQLSAAKVLVVGAGGLGCPALLYLTCLGIGTIGIVDDDKVTIANLHRQLLYTEADIGKSKVVTAAQRLQQHNSSIKILAHAERLVAANANRLISGYNVVVDCSDNIETRYLIDQVTAAQQKPFIYAGIRRFEGQVGVFNYKGSPSFADTFPDKERFTAEQDCAAAGIIGCTAGMVACLQVNEVIKCVLELAGVVAGEILTVDLQTLVMRKWKLARSDYYDAS